MRLKLACLAGLALAATCHATDAWREPNTEMEFVAIPKGCFKMGLPDKAFEEAEGKLFYDRVKIEKPEHEVCLDAFWMGRHEVRIADWQKVMGPGKSGPAEAPVGGITRAEAEAFARRLTEMSGGRERFRLPTEAEWEYACRAGAPAVTWPPNRRELDDRAWYSSHYSGPDDQRLKSSQPVGSKQPNAFGLHDMLGNVWEWVQDDYRPDAYAKHALYNPVVADGKLAKQVIRGGGWRTDRRLVRCETRAWMPAPETQDTIGLRLVRTR